MYKIVILIIVIVSQSVTSSIAEENFTVEGDGLTLVREFNIESDEAELLFEDESFIVEIDTIKQNEFLSLPIDRNYRKIRETNETAYLVFFNSKLEIVRVKKGYPGEICYLRPLGSDGSLAKSSGYEMYHTYSSFLKKMVYDNNGKFIKTLEAEGYLNTFPSGKYFIVTNSLGSNSSGTGVRSIQLYRDDASLVDSVYWGTDEYRNGEFSKSGSYCRPFNKDVDYFAISDVRSAYASEEMPRGTKIFDDKSKLLFTLRPGSLIASNRNIGFDSSFYGSANYICQITDAGEFINEYSERFANKGFGEIESSGKYSLEVYGFDGTPLWDYEFADKSEIFSLAVSDNEKYLCVAYGIHAGVSELRFDVFKTSTGKKVSEFMKPFGSEYYFGRSTSVSNDGSLVCYLYKDLNTESNILSVYENNIEVCTIRSKENGENINYLCPNKNTLIVGIGNSVSIYSVR